MEVVPQANEGPTRPRLRAFGLRARLLLLVLLAIAPAAALLIHNAAEQRRHDTAEVLESALRLARNSALRQGEFIGDIRKFLETLAQLPVVREAARHGNCSPVFARLRDIHRQYANFGVARPNGDIVCSAVPYTSRINIADRAFFRRALATREFSMSGLQTGRIIGKPTIPFGYPVIDERGEIQALVFAALDLAWLNTMLAATQLPEGAALVVVSDEGTVLARHPDPEQWVGKALPDAPLVRALLDRRGEGSIRARGLDGVRRLYAFAALSDRQATGLYVTVGIPEAEAFGQANEALARGVLLMAVIGIAVAALAWFGSDWLVLRRINTLSAAAHRLGQGNLSARTGLPHTGDELGRLARDFDEMARAIEEREQRVRESRATLEAALASMTDAVLISGVGGEYLEFNDAFATFHRFKDKAECAAKLADYPKVIDVFMANGEAAPPDRWAVPRALRGETATNAEYILRRKDTGETWVGSYSFGPIRDRDGAIVGAVVVARDITERKRAEENIQKLNAELALRVHELERVSRALRTLSAGNHAMLRATDEQALLDSMCRAVVDAGGYHMALVFYRDDEPGTLRPMAEAGYPGGVAALRTLKMTWNGDEHGRGAVACAIRGGQPSVVRDMLTDPDYAPWRAHLHGSVSGVACPLRVGGETVGALSIYAAEPDAFDPEEVKLLTECADDLAHGIATLRDRRRQEQMQEAVHRLSHSDPMTGLPNEADFMERLALALRQAEESNRPLALLHLNVVRLHDINTALGFEHGNFLLKEMAERLRKAVADPAIVARLHGDIFAVALPGANADLAVKTAKELQSALHRTYALAGVGVDARTRIGIALFPGHGADPDTLLRRADLALRQAKHAERDYALYKPEAERENPRRLALASELRQAIENGELTLYVQPKYNYRGRIVCSAEALARWQHPRLGLVPPGEFIGLAEQIGLIKPLTEWITEAAYRQRFAWSKQGLELSLAVNLSAKNLHERRLVNRIAELRDAWGANGNWVEFEITESAIMQDTDRALGVLEELSDRGNRIAIDDFGTGHSSLAYLARFPVYAIKIDRSFTSRLIADLDAEQIVKSVIQLAHNLDLKVVAEGCEDRATFDRLAALDCDAVQGYFIAKPMPAEDFAGWLAGFRSPEVPGPTASKS